MCKGCYDTPANLFNIRLRLSKSILQGVSRVYVLCFIILSIWYPFEPVSDIEWINDGVIVSVKFRYNGSIDATWILYLF